MKFNQKAFNRFADRQGVVKFSKKPITLESGRRSHWYVDWRTPLGEVNPMHQLTAQVVNFIEHHELDPFNFYGVPEDATELDTMVSYRWITGNRKDDPRSLPIPMGRFKDRFFLGDPKLKTIVLEHVTTTGRSLLETLDALAEVDVEVIATVCLTNRMEKSLGEEGRKGVAEIIKRERGIPHYSMSTAQDLLPLAYKRLKPGEDIRRAIEAEFENHGLEPLKLVNE